MCTKTVMDTTDPDIVFDENGICNYVHHFESKIKPVLEPHPNKQPQKPANEFKFRRRLKDEIPKSVTYAENHWR